MYEYNIIYNWINGQINIDLDWLKLRVWNNKILGFSSWQATADKTIFVICIEIVDISLQFKIFGVLHHIFGESLLILKQLVIFNAIEIIIWVCANTLNLSKFIAYFFKVWRIEDSLSIDILQNRGVYKIVFPFNCFQICKHVSNGYRFDQIRKIALL